MAVDEELAALAERVQARCIAARLTCATAESCTGGLVAHAITSIAGSSAYFRGAIVAYEDSVKEALLGVPAEVLAAHGAVSAQVARAMATGARERLGVDLAVGVTGIAGPSGATPGKPVGLTYLATASRQGIDVRRETWAGDRAANIRSSAAAALELLLTAAEAGA
ncbi:MAG TPA: CinA family protein [Candidatus Limnocylindrales bacterium]|nr:CinA family protein [Candidatus Limnocylindrales bacterium]